jgi:acetyl esterase
MPFDPQVQVIRDWLEHQHVPNLALLPLREARAAEMRAAIAATGRPENVAEVRELRIPGPAGDLAARLYQPGGGRSAGAGPWPMLLYFFGGGWSLGTLDSCDGACRMLTNLAQCMTLSVAYRLAPEHKFPAAVEDCYAAAAWAAAHSAELGADPGQLAVGGDSSGGNLAAAVTLLARQRGGPAIMHQLLVYPVTDYHADTASMREITEPHFLHQQAIDSYWDRYLTSPQDGDSPLASPLRAADLTGLPPATIISAEFDPLRDEGQLYADRLQEAGVAADVLQYDGMMHGFFTMVGILDASKLAVIHAAARLRAAFTAVPAP